MIINLLPRGKKEEIQRRRRFQFVIGWELAIVLILLFSFSFLWAVDYLIEADTQILATINEGELNGEKYSAVKHYQDKFLDINDRLSVISKIDADQLYWTELFLKLSETIPAQIEISTLSTRDYGVFLVGMAETRDVLLEYRDRLSKESCFSEVTLPLSNLVSKENIAFQIDLEINPDCLKKQ